MSGALVIDTESRDRLTGNAKARPKTGQRTLTAKTLCTAGHPDEATLTSVGATLSIG